MDPNATIDATNNAANNSVAPAWLHLPHHWPAQGDLMQWAHDMSPGTATILVIGGIIYLMFGYYAFKGLITLNAAMIGACLGAVIGDRLADSAAIGGIVGAVLLGATTWPTMKYAVALMGGILGALVGAALWRSFNLDYQFAWAGALIGLITFGMCSFIMFKGSVMTYTSLQGAGMLIFGLLGLVFKYKSVSPQVAQHMHLKPFLLPLSIFIPTVLGLIYQQTTNAEQPAAAKKK